MEEETEAEKSEKENIGGLNSKKANQFEGKKTKLFLNKIKKPFRKLEKRGYQQVSNENSVNKEDRGYRLFSDTLIIKTPTEELKERASSVEPYKDKEAQIPIERNHKVHESGVLESVMVAGALYFLRNKSFKNHVINLNDWQKINWNFFTNDEIEKILKNASGILFRYRNRRVRS